MRISIFLVATGVFMLLVGAGCEDQLVSFSPGGLVPRVVPAGTLQSVVAPSVASQLAQTTRAWEIFGMDCPGCQGGLEKLVTRIDGVTKARADWRQKSLKVDIAAGAEVEAAAGEQPHANTG